MADGEDDLDDLLDSALEDFQKVQKNTSTDAPARPLDKSGASHHSGPPDAECNVPVEGPRGGAAPGEAREGNSVEAKEVKGLGLGLKKKKPKKAAAQAAKGSSDSGSGTGAGPSLAPQIKVSGGASEGSGKAPVVRKGVSGRQDTLAQLAERTRETVEGMRVPERSAEGEDTETTPEEEEMMEKLVKQFEDMGTQDIQGLMDTMLQQLLSKDVLHEPMVEIRDRYPAWLTENQGRLPPDDLARYTRQYGCTQHLCQLYEQNPPADFKEILAVMKDMQECGQPPADIIKDLAPGLEIGQDGLPMLPDLGSGGLPPNCPTM